MKDLWERIERFLENQAPHVLSTLRPGASSEQLADLQTQLGVELPEQFRELYRVHNGQKDVPTFSNNAGAGFGLFGAVWLLGLDDILSTWQYMRSVEAGSNKLEGWPYNPRWIPLARTSIFGNLCLDLSTASEPHPVRCWGVLGTNSDIAAKDLRTYMVRFVNELECGVYGPNLDGQLEYEFFRFYWEPCPESYQRRSVVIDAFARAIKSGDPYSEEFLAGVCYRYGVDLLTLNAELGARQVNTPLADETIMRLIDRCKEIRVENERVRKETAEKARVTWQLQQDRTTLN